MQGKTDLNSFQNTDFKVGANPMKRILWYALNFTVFNSAWFPFYGLKCLVLRLFGAEIGKGVIIKPRVNIKYPWKLSIGDYTWIGEQVWIDNLSMVKIADNCCISQGAMLLTGNHNYKKSTFDLITKEIELESGVWVGAHAVVCPGVKMLSHSILTVNSVAVANTEAFYIYQGNPAQKLRERKL